MHGRGLHGFLLTHACHPWQLSAAEEEHCSDPRLSRSVLRGFHDRVAVKGLLIASADPPFALGLASTHRHDEEGRVLLVAACHLGSARELVSEGAAEPRADLDAAELVALGRAVRSLSCACLLVGAIDDDESARLLELQLSDRQSDGLRDAQARSHEHLGERPIDLCTGIEVQRDLL